jgi:putative methionine-R-sulfoxide reductase with GAF domain
MSAHSNLDREAFQMLLASAFWVQDSGICKQSLSVLVEVQKSIAKHESLEGILALIADRSRIVAGATGIAIGLLTESQLVYRAGSGDAAGCVGQHLTAVLSLPGQASSQREILRVDNAETDGRIEAAICREREARALLIMPIYVERIVAGVLEIRFSEPHTFDDKEIRTYRLTAGLVEDAIRTDIQRSETSASTIQPPAPAVRDSLETPPPTVPQAHRRIPMATGVISRLSPAHNYENTITWQANSPVFRAPRWIVDAALLVTILGLAAWISIHDRASTSIKESPTLNTSSSIPKPSAKIIPGNHDSKEQRASYKTESASRARSPFTRIRVGTTEVDYSAEDVTIRRFATSAADPRARTVNRQFDIGDDVTVRIFTDSSAVPLKRGIGSRR